MNRHRDRRRRSADRADGYFQERDNLSDDRFATGTEVSNSCYPGPSHRLSGQGPADADHQDRVRPLWMRLS